MTDWLMLFLGGDGGLGTLFVSALISATLMPGASEALLGTMLQIAPANMMMLIAVASLGNTIGSVLMYGVGRTLPKGRLDERALDRVRRYGAPVLLLAWVPVVGDALPVAAGWLRLKAFWCVLFIGIGKTLRYAAVAGVLQAAFGA